MKKTKATATTPALSRLLNNIEPYYRKIDVDLNILKATPKTRRKWESFLIESECQFSDFYKANSGLNFYQVACLCFVADYKYKYPSMLDSQLIEMINQNIDDFQLENIMQFTAQYSPKKSTQLVKKAA